MTYLHGAYNIIPGLERAMADRSVGDEFQVTIEPADAYGEKKEAKFQRISAKHFPISKEVETGSGCRLTEQEGAGPGHYHQGRTI